MYDHYDEDYPYDRYGNHLQWRDMVYDGDEGDGTDEEAQTTSHLCLAYPSLDRPMVNCFT